MAIDEGTRQRVHRSLEEVHGAEVANALMTVFPPVPWPDVATKADVERMGDGLRLDMTALRSELRGEMAGVRGEMAELRSELRSELHGEVNGLHAKTAILHDEISSLRTDLSDKITGLRVELSDKITRVEGELSELRVGVAQLGAKVDGQFAKLLIAYIPMMFGFAALVLAAVKLG